MENVLLLAMGELIRQEISASQLLARLVDVMAQRLDADRGTLYLLDAERQELVSVAAHLPELEELRVPLGQGVAGFVGRHGQLVNLTQSDTHAHFWPQIDARTGYKTETMLAGPLRHEGVLLGVVQLLNKRGQRAFDAQDEQALMELSKQAAALLAQTTLAPRAQRAAPTRGELSLESPSLGERFNRIIGQGAAMRVIFQSLRRVAPTDATVLIRGESGTGKGLIARALHVNSARAQAPLVHVDCTTLPETLIENELFGHERGAYTGAHARKLGQVELAQGGTLFLDEIGDLPLSVQGKLLTLLQERTFTRVGGAARQAADLRIVAATNRDLEALVAQKLFREDLYYRLRVVQLALPSLRERGAEDVRALIEHFVEAACRRHKRPLKRVREDAMALLLSYHWPGNVRELENCVEAAVIFSDDEISPSTLSLPRPATTQRLQAIRAQAPAWPGWPQLGSPLPQGSYEGVYEGPQEPAQAANDAHPFEQGWTLAQLERRYVAHMLERHQGNRSSCARALGIGRNTLLRKLKEHGLE